MGSFTRKSKQKCSVSLNFEHSQGCIVQHLQNSHEINVCNSNVKFFSPYSVGDVSLK